MPGLKREHVDVLLGIGVLVLGLAILLFTFSQALSISRNPGDFFRDQMASANQQIRPPTADFTYSGFDLNVTFSDTSQLGDASILSWEWNFGDNVTTSVRNPTHRFFGFGSWQVSLAVRDANGQESRTFGQVTLGPQQPTSGNAVGNPFGGAGGVNLNLDIGVFLIPVGIGLLTTGMFLVMAFVGGIITKAGWNLIKPRPETVRVRLKPSDLTSALQEDSVAIGSGNPFPPPPTR